MVNHTDALYSALSDATRRDILARVAVQPLPIGVIAGAYNMSQPAVTKHIKALEAAGLIARERQGKKQLISAVPDALSIADTFIAKYDLLLRNRLTTLEQYLTVGPTVAQSTKRKQSAPKPEIVTIVQDIDRDVATVWDAYTNPKLIPHWWTSPGTTMIRCEVDARAGGIWSFTVRNSNGEDSTRSGVFADVVPRARLVYSDGFGDNRNDRREALVEVIFEENTSGGTRITKKITSNQHVSHVINKKG